MHKQAALIAKEEGISLNQYINDAIISRNSELSTLNYISQKVSAMVDQLGQRFLRHGSSSRSETSFNVSFQAQDTSFYGLKMAKS